MRNKAPLDELSVAVGRIMGLLLTEEKVNDAVRHLAVGIRQSVPGSIGSGVSLLDERGRRISTGFTDDVVAEVDHFQYELGQGRCLTSWATGRSVLVQDVSTDTRWPEWSNAVAHLPIRSVLSAPLIAGKQALGALKVYAEHPNSYDDRSVPLLEAFASPAATLLSHIQTTETVDRMSATLQGALASRDLINQAAGSWWSAGASPRSRRCGS